MKPELIHGSSVEIKGMAVLITGKSGSGKSSLALNLIDRGAILISDDQSQLSLEAGKIIVNAPPRIKGILEVRGVGLIQFPTKEKASLGLCVELLEEENRERLPETHFFEYYNINIPVLRLCKYDPLGAIKVELKINAKDKANHY
jgi:serine kinase of HPr protein (carbohydrate metabolism regulator)